MKWVVGELERLAVRPARGNTAELPNGFIEFHDTVKLRAWEIMREQEWINAT